MENGIRFDLEYETMPWHRVDAVVFDIGNILIRYAPNDFLEQLFPGDEQKQRDMMARVYRGPFWENFDRGTMEYADSREVIQRGADMLGWSLDELLTRTLDAMRVVEPLVAEQEAKEAK